MGFVMGTPFSLVITKDQAEYYDKASLVSFVGYLVNSIQNNIEKHTKGAPHAVEWAFVERSDGCIEINAEVFL